MRISYSTPLFSDGVSVGLSRFIVHGGQVGLVFLGLQFEQAQARLWLAIAFAVLSVVGWLIAIKRWRLLSDTPTSKIATAAQGYVELSGRGQPLGGLPLLSPFNGLPCLWYRYLVEVKDNDGKWRTDSETVSDASLILDDGSGECLVDPAHAEVISNRKDSREEGDARYTQWLLLKDERLYVLGQFTTRTALDLQLDTNEDIKATLSEWKRDNGNLLKRFDLNKDGQLDLREWELARNAARREVAAQHLAARNTADLHQMQAPPDGRLYLISNIPTEKLARRYQWWAWGHLAAFFAALYAAVYFYHHGAAL